MTKYQARVFRLAIGARLKERRLELGMTQEGLAWEGGISQGSISLYERGRIEIPLGALLDLCRALRISPVDIVPDLVMADSTLEQPQAS